MSAGGTVRIGFLGAGQMATALAKGWLAARLANTEPLLASDPVVQARESFACATGAATRVSNREVIAGSDVLVLAVKPQSMPKLLADIRPVIGTEHLVISIAAGWTLGQLSAGLGEDRRIVRVMPNTPCLVGASASGFCLGEAATPADAELVDKLLRAAGCAFRVPETLMDAVTGLSASGPAFVYVIIEALSDGGVRMGLPRDV